MLTITTPDIALPLLPFLSPRDYGNFLCTCREGASYDYKVIWKNYTLNHSFQSHGKSLALVKDLLNEYGPLHLLYEQVTPQRMRVLLNCFRWLVDKETLKQAYDIYMNCPHRCKTFDTMVRMERIFVGSNRRSLQELRRSRR